MALDTGSAASAYCPQQLPKPDWGKVHMRPLDAIKEAEGRQLEDESGTVTTLKLLPPLNDAEIRDLESSLPCPLPEEARELFSYCRGLDGGPEGTFTDIVQEVEFSGLGDVFGLEEIFPHSVPVVHDGAGNFWVVDLVGDSTSWGPIFYACHDPPVIVYQTDSLAHFISELLRLGNPPRESELAGVHNEHDGRIWRENPGVMTHDQCLGSGDADLEEFARSLDETWLFVDLRRPRLGEGFSWGRYSSRPDTLQRHGETRLFACQQQRRSFWRRLLEW